MDEATLCSSATGKGPGAWDDSAVSPRARLSFRQRAEPRSVLTDGRTAPEASLSSSHSLARMPLADPRQSKSTPKVSISIGHCGSKGKKTSRKTPAASSASCRRSRERGMKGSSGAGQVEEERVGWVSLPLERQ